MTVPIHKERSTTLSAKGAGRRRTLVATAVLWLAPWMTRWARAAQRVTATSHGGEQGFIELSKVATGHANLDPQVGAALLAALMAHDRGFGAKLAALEAFSRRQGISDVDSLDLALEGNPLRADLKTIIAAWYTGAVGEGAKAKEVTYAGALMYAPSADGSHNPGICAGATNSWAGLPRPPIDVLPKA